MKFNVGDTVKVISKDDYGWVGDMDYSLGKVFKVTRVNALGHPTSVMLENGFIYDESILAKWPVAYKNESPYRRIVL